VRAQLISSLKSTLTIGAKICRSYSPTGASRFARLTHHLPRRKFRHSEANTNAQKFFFAKRKTKLHNCTKRPISGVADCKIEGKTAVLAGCLKVEIWISGENVVSLYYRGGRPRGFPLF
jgi:hypothetical protein